MASVEIFDFVGGEQLEKFIGTMPGVQAELRRHVMKAHAEASAHLAWIGATAPDQDRQAGDSGVEVHIEQADVDWHLVLDDTNSDHAAAAIEFGTKNQDGHYIIHKAMGLM